VVGQAKCQNRIQFTIVTIKTNGFIRATAAKGATIVAAYTQQNWDRLAHKAK